MSSNAEIKVKKKSELDKQKSELTRRLEAKNSLEVNLLYTLICVHPEKAEEFIREGKHRDVIAV